MAEPGQRKEDYLFKAARYARDRGLSLLAVDLFGADAGSRFDEVVGRRDLETAVGVAMDYLLERDDVDEGRIAILSDQMQSSFVARGIAFDDRFAAAVCDGGLWDLNEREFLRERIAPDDADIIVSPALSRVARNIKCPVLIPARRRGGLEPERVQELVGWMRAGGRDVTLEIFGDGETTAQGQSDNPTLAGEFIFDWIDAQLAIVRPIGRFQKGGLSARLPGISDTGRPIEQAIIGAMGFILTQSESECSRSPDAPGRAANWRGGSSSFGDQISIATFMQAFSSLFCSALSLSVRSSSSPLSSSAKMNSFRVSCCAARAARCL